MEKLNNKEIEETRRTFNNYNDENLSCLTVTLARLGLDCIDTIKELKEKIWMLENRDIYPNT